METKALYIHIPFCQNICSYCDFCKVFYQENVVNQYLEALQKELDALSIQGTMGTIYIGGGTPSSLSVQQLTTLMKMIAPYIDEDTKEVSIEVNPESMNKEKLHILYAGKVNRLSIGVQTFNQSILHTLERQHTNAQVLDVIVLAKKIGFTNISIDLMYGLPNQTKEDVEKDIVMLRQLSIQHVSYYALILEEHTQLNNQECMGMDEDEEAIIQAYIHSSLEELGFHQYEVSNYAKEGFSSKHNLVYWRYDNYYGIGIGASSKIDDLIIEHNRNIFAYIHGENTKNEIAVSKEDSIFNTIMMSLRLLEGLDIEKTNQDFNIDIEKRYEEVILKYIQKGWLHITKRRLHCDTYSLQYLHTILVDFLDI
jgi:oxygen-independent coproporphyrinogen-3 oxidase